MNRAALARSASSLAVSNGALAAASGGYGALLVVLRGRPSIGLDAGVFLSVAGRLLHGAHLYSGVWDNKDPLFFYVDAAALWIAGWKGPFLLDIVWVAVAAGSMVLLVDELGGSRPAKLAGFLVYPLLLTGQWYYAGYSMLAALAAAPLAAWLWVRGSAVWAGVVVALGVLFKVNLALVLLAAPAALLLVRAPTQDRGRAAVRFVAGLGGSLALGAILLATRGELGPYLSMLRDNVSYANDVLVANGRPAGLHGHIRVSEDATRHARLVILVFVAGAALAVAILVRRRRRASRGALPASAALLLCAVIATGLTLALTAAWNHHVQMLAYPGALLAVFAVEAIGTLRRTLAARSGAQLAAAVLVVVLLGGQHAAASSGPASVWVHGVHSRTAAALVQVRTLRLPRAASVSYAHLGQNDEEGQGAFIGSGWTLACSRFHQYPWTPAATLESILRCVGTRRPQLLLITSSLSDRPGAPPAWHRFVVASHALARSSYRRVYFQRNSDGTIAVWERR